MQALTRQIDSHSLIILCTPVTNICLDQGQDNRALQNSASRTAQNSALAHCQDPLGDEPPTLCICHCCPAVLPSPQGPQRKGIVVSHLLVSPTLMHREQPCFSLRSPRMKRYGDSCRRRWGQLSRPHRPHQLRHDGQVGRRNQDKRPKGASSCWWRRCSSPTS